MHYRERHHPRRQSVRGSGNGRLGEPLLQKSTCHGHLAKSFGRRNDRRSLTLQDLKVDLLLLKQGSSVMNFLQRRPCPSIRSSFALLFITEHQKINSFPVHFPSPAPLISFPFVLQFQSVNEEDEWSGGGGERGQNAERPISDYL